MKEEIRMSKDQQYSIGEFSNMTGVSIRTLHYYDEIGLLNPIKQPESGHRIYRNQDVLALQKITSLKFLGYSLELIKSMMNETNFDLSLKDSLELQQKALVEKKEQIDTVLGAIKRTISLLEKNDEIDSTILMTLIHSFQTEKDQRIWLEQYLPKDITDDLFKKSEEEMLALDMQYIDMSNEVKRLFGRPIDDPEVQSLVERSVQASLAFAGEEVAQSFSNLDSIELSDLDAMVQSPFSEEEQDWLNQAMEYYMRCQGMIG